MKTPLYVALVALAVMPLAAANLQIAGSILGPPYRLVIIETCLPLPVTPKIYSGNAALLGCLDLTKPPGSMKAICSWTSSPNCGYKICAVVENGGSWVFAVYYPTPPFTCNDDLDKATFKSGVLLPTGCCPP